jgi:multimeric flavodoxin WrbA
MKTVFLISSRNPTGQTARAAAAMAAGLEAEGAQTQTHLLPTMSLERCRQCEDNGWGICRSEGSCVIEDDFASLVEAMAAADAVVFATPVYFSDLSESLRALLDRLRRTRMSKTPQGNLAEKPAVGICVAGGGGRGAPACATSLTEVLLRCGFDVRDVLPVRRQNLEAKCQHLTEMGRELAKELAGH